MNGWDAYKKALTARGYTPAPPGQAHHFEHDNGHKVRLVRTGPPFSSKPSRTPRSKAAGFSWVHMSRDYPYMEDPKVGKTVASLNKLLDDAGIYEIIERLIDGEDFDNLVS